jgi:hypothetical protein
MKNPLVAFLMIVAAPLAAFAGGPNFIVCKSTYALCTTAACTPIHGTDKYVSCKCDVETDYSAGLKRCDGKKNSKGQLVRSRYHPISSYAQCSNDRPWAWCLDAPCVVDSQNPTQAACRCSVAANQGDYVIVNADGQYDSSSCTTGMYSSATVVQLGQVTNYLKTHNTPLHPVAIKVFKGR